MVADGGSKQFTGGYSQLFQRLIGYTPRWTFTGNPMCFEHASKPYLTVADTNDWAWVTVNRKTTPTDRKAAIEPFNLPALRTATALTLSLPRVGFYTTPAFLALWNTNDSNQHRVTANQTLLVALGESFTSANVIIPLSTAGLDTKHSVERHASASGATRASIRCGSSGHLVRLQRPQRFPRQRGVQRRGGEPAPGDDRRRARLRGRQRRRGATSMALGTLLAKVTDGAGDSR